MCWRLLPMPPPWRHTALHASGSNREKKISLLQYWKKIKFDRNKIISNLGQNRIMQEYYFVPLKCEIFLGILSKGLFFQYFNNHIGLSFSPSSYQSLNFAIAKDVALNLFAYFFGIFCTVIHGSFVYFEKLRKTYCYRL